MEAQEQISAAQRGHWRFRPPRRTRCAIYRCPRRPKGAIVAPQSLGIWGMSVQSHRATPAPPAPATASAPAGGAGRRFIAWFAKNHEAVANYLTLLTLIGAAAGFFWQYFANNASERKREMKAE
jgi:hypothetical protein